MGNYIEKVCLRNFLRKVKMLCEVEIIDEYMGPIYSGQLSKLLLDFGLLNFTTHLFVKRVGVEDNTLVIECINDIQ